MDKYQMALNLKADLDDVDRMDEKAAKRELKIQIQTNYDGLQRITGLKEALIKSLDNVLKNCTKEEFEYLCLDPEIKIYLKDGYQS